MALWKSLLLSGRPRCIAMLVAPADSPNSVTLLGSPPKLWMWSRTHFSANCWSFNPMLPVSNDVFWRALQSGKKHFFVLQEVSCKCMCHFPACKPTCRMKCCSIFCSGFFQVKEIFVWCLSSLRCIFFCKTAGVTSLTHSVPRDTRREEAEHSQSVVERYDHDVAVRCQYAAVVLTLRTRTRLKVPAVYVHLGEKQWTLCLGLQNSTAFKVRERSSNGKTQILIFWRRQNLNRAGSLNLVQENKLVSQRHLSTVSETERKQHNGTARGNPTSHSHPGHTVRLFPSIKGIRTRHEEALLFSSLKCMTTHYHDFASRTLWLRSPYVEV